MYRGCRTCRVKSDMSLLLTHLVLLSAWLGFVEPLQLADPVSSAQHFEHNTVMYALLTSQVCVGATHVDIALSCSLYCVLAQLPGVT